jgi:uncharacterized SAM-binding protein YcdF (DUF218 family)
MLETSVFDAPLRKRRHFGRIAIAATLGLCASVVVIFFFGIGRWLVVEDPLEKARAIAVLSGRMPMRAIEAAHLYHAGYAPEVWLTRPKEPMASLQALHVAYLGEDFFNTQVLMHEGVPENAVRVLQPAIDNTADEIRAITAELERQKGSRVIIVTTKAHTRRVRTLWRKLSQGTGRAIVQPANEDPFDPTHWWRNTQDALDVVRETLGLLNAWAGLPLRPQPDASR